MIFGYHRNPKLPALAWALSLQKDSDVVRVVHGSKVETQKRFFVEGARGGDFGTGDFAGSELFLGSGASIEEGNSLSQPRHIPLSVCKASEAGTG